MRPVQLRRCLAQQILAGDAQMHVAGQQRRRDLAPPTAACTSMSGKPAKRGAIAARARGLLQRQAGIGEIGVATCPCRRPLDGMARVSAAITRLPAERRAASTRSVRMAQPMAGIALLGAEHFQQRVVAAAARDLHRAFGVARPQLEHEAGVIFHVAAETGGEAARCDGSMPSDLQRGQPRLHRGQRRVERDAGGLASARGFRASACSRRAGDCQQAGDDVGDLRDRDAAPRHRPPAPSAARRSPRACARPAARRRPDPSGLRSRRAIRFASARPDAPSRRCASLAAPWVSRCSSASK